MSFFDLELNVLRLVVFSSGLVLGSFLNSFIWRTKEQINIWKGRSQCTCCREQLRWYEIIPVISYIFLLGRCRKCRSFIPWHYPVVELGTALILLHTFYLGSYTSFYSWFFLRDIFLVVLLVILFVYDALYKIILNSVIVLGVIGGVLVNIFSFSSNIIGSIGVGILIGGGFFLLQFLVSRGTWIGLGDVFLGIMMGAWLGWQGVLLALFLSYIFGAIYGLLLLATRKKSWQSEVPLAPFLALGTFFSFYYGNNLIIWCSRFLV